MLLQPLIAWCIKMSEKQILNVNKPQTQTVESIKALLSWRGRAADPLPQYVAMGDGDSRLVLVLSNKKDCYYTTTAAECSCPAHNWHPGQRCKHQRAHFPQEVAATRSPAAIKQLNTGIWHGHNGPIAPEETQARGVAPSSSFELVDTTPDANHRELAYWSIQEDRAMWPAEA